jgi:hypothetical protein
LRNITIAGGQAEDLSLLILTDYYFFTLNMGEPTFGVMAIHALPIFSKYSKNVIMFVLIIVQI